MLRDSDGRVSVMTGFKRGTLCDVPDTPSFEVKLADSDCSLLIVFREARQVQVAPLYSILILALGRYALGRQILLILLFLILHILAVRIFFELIHAVQINSHVIRL